MRSGVEIDNTRTPKASSTSSFNRTSWPGPALFLTDSIGRIGIVELATGKVTALGSTNIQLTDITFCPNGRMYGVSFTALYRINKSPLGATLIGSFGSLGINALACNKAGKLYAYSNSYDRLYSISVSTGAATLIRSSTGYYSAGDLVFHENSLALASTDRRIVFLNPKTGSVISSVTHGISNLFGLVSVGPNELYGCAGTNIFKINSRTGATRLLGTYSSTSLGSCYGATFNGNFR